MPRISEQTKRRRKEAVRLFDCPTCGRKAGQRCGFDVMGKTQGNLGSPHRERLQLLDTTSEVPKRTMPTERPKEKMPTNYWEAFEVFHADNPEVYRLFKQFAESLRNAGHKCFGAKAIMERIRWHYAIDVKNSAFKINNNHTAYYARKLMKEDKRFSGFFKTRKVDE
jgi:hypothetical protein